MRTTAISGRSAAIVRSDSSPSTTSQPSPARALPPSCGISPPIEVRGVAAKPARQKAIIAGRRRLAVRAGDDDRAAQRDELGEQLRPRRPADASANAVETTTSQPSGAAGSGAITTSIAAPRERPGRASRPGPSRRPRPPRRARAARTREARAADADEPDPPPASGGKLRSAPPAISSAASGRASATHRARPSAARRAGSPSSERDELGHAAELGLRHDDGAAAASK